MNIENEKRSNQIVHDFPTLECFPCEKKNGNLKPKTKKMPNIDNKRSLIIQKMGLQSANSTFYVDVLPLQQQGNQVKTGPVELYSNETIQNKSMLNGNLLACSKNLIILFVCVCLIKIQTSF